MGPEVSQLREFLAGGGDLVEVLGADEAAVVAMVYELADRLDAGQRRAEAARLLAIGARYLEEPGGPDRPPVTARLLCRIRWCSELLDDDRLRAEVEPVLRRAVPWPDWPRVWQLVA